MGSKDLSQELEQMSPSRRVDKCATKPTSSSAQDPHNDTSLPLDHQPLVTIRVQNAPDGDNHEGDYQEFVVSKELLCRHSAYFKAMLEGNFKEAKEQKCVLPYMEGVVSVRSFKGLLQWLNQRSVISHSTTPEERISTAIELSRLADMCNIRELDREICRYLSILLTVLLHRHKEYVVITAEHVKEVLNLPSVHPVRCLLVTRYLLVSKMVGEDVHRDRFPAKLIVDPHFEAEFLFEMKPHLARMTRRLRDERAALGSNFFTWYSNSAILFVKAHRGS